jgi:nucleotide-binding universal stress UspA family protein
MHVLVATAGALSPEPVVGFARHLIGGTGSVTVVTVVEVPHGFLEDLSTEDWHPLHDAPAGNGELAAQYLDERGRRLTDPIRQALEQARIPCEVRVVEGDDPAAAISDAADELGADVVLLGATKQIFDRDAWESVSARVMLESGRPVLVVPEARRPAATVEELDEAESAGDPVVQPRDDLAHGDPGDGDPRSSVLPGRSA